MNYQLQPIPNFTLEEMRCKCGCGLIIINRLLINCVDRLRRRWMEPINPNSWTRCPSWNKHEGGKSNSYHLYGKAVDLSPVSGQFDEFVEMCRIYFMFVKPYSLEEFCHCDVRGARTIQS